MIVGRAAGGIEALALKSADGVIPELTAEQLERLCEVALRIERYFKQPQDIEWVQEQKGSLFIIQTRRLQLVPSNKVSKNLSEALSSYPVLLDHCGMVACRGVAQGTVYRLDDESQIDEVPAAAVLVTRRASPRFASAMPRIAAIVTDIGAPTGHMAALAREFRVPTIVDCGQATTLLAHGQAVTVDADDNRVYAGQVDELMHHQLAAESGYEDSVEYRMLRRLLKRLTPLGLIDPQSAEFRAERCRTIHDVIRFAHEKAVEELINLHATGTLSSVESARRLDSELPLGLRIIDIGGGLDVMLSGVSPKAAVKAEAIRSLPMRALWQGLTTPGVWSTRPVGIDFRTFMSSAMSGSLTSHAGKNLAVLSEAYVNLSLNLGYHYTMVDAYVSDDRDANHVYFRFIGGASDAERRIRRARLVREILERLDFAVRQSRDLVIARLRKFDRTQTEERLCTIGRLIGFTRQIDALMNNEELASHYLEAFLQGDYSTEITSQKEEP
jgi:pyruvate,water dikinase